MHRIDTPGSLAGLFRDGDPYATPALGGTILDAAWANAVQEALVQTILGAGLTLEKGNDLQLVDAIRNLAADYFYRGREMIAQARPSLTTLDQFGLPAATITGTAAAATFSSADGPTLEVSTINHAGGTAETIGFEWAYDLTKRSWIPDLEFTAELGFASNCRLWGGLFSSSPDLLSDLSSITGAGFRFDPNLDATGSGGDGTLKVVTANGSGATVKSTGIAFGATTRYRLRVRRDAVSAALFRFYVDGIEVAQHSGTEENVPGAATALGPALVMRHLTDTQQKRLRLGWLRLRSR